MTSVQGSPFVVAGPAQPGELIGRHRILATLRDRAERGRFVLLVAPRRYGKTTLVHRLRHDAEADQELDVVVVDLLGIQTLDDLALRLAQAWTRLPRGPLARAAAAVLPYVDGIDLRGGLATLQLRRPGATEARTLEAVLDLPRAVAERTGKRVLVVLDEFQAIASVDRADAIIRSQVQHHTDRVSYLFAGSERSTLHMLFTDVARPLYGQAEMLPLDPFDPEELASYVSDHLAGAGSELTPAALTAYLAATEGHPQRAMLVADCLWDDVGRPVIDRPEVDAAVDRALVRCRPELEATTDLLTGAQLRVLRIVAFDEPLTGAAARRLGLTQGSSRSAASTLTDRGLLQPAPQRPKIVDPMLAAWIRRTVTAP